MNICVAGDVHGRIDKFYENIRDFELRLKINFDIVLQVGDFGIWIDEKNHDGTTKLHNGIGDFPEWYKEKRAVPVKTYFVNGNNEDFNFLNAVKLSGDFEILKNLFYIPNGTAAKVEIENGSSKGSLVVAGIGGKYAPEHFKYSESDRHYTQYEIDNLIGYADENKGDKDKQIDIFISHDAPEGVLIEDNDKNRYYPKAVGFRELILQIKPKMVFFGHHHGVCKSEIEGIPVYGLNVLGKKDSLFAFKMENGAITTLGKY
ncbi:MAG: metallophosphoesterase [Deltaproteobacteria bacterium]|jgi:Icc-related predicted phosphoesterase|nr:metallophosphoesterase [Deltaproteobacteria bacterium]MCL5880384.1 metallophosphoesterase [Deltaproteobacteria bacterium]MDA8303794.1 metallophosphoesterase [Deltaproteobacteria bacterium]